MHISENLEKNISQIFFRKISLEIGFRKITNSLLQTFHEFCRFMKPFMKTCRLMQQTFEAKQLLEFHT